MWEVGGLGDVGGVLREGVGMEGQGRGKGEGGGGEAGKGWAGGKAEDGRGEGGRVLNPKDSRRQLLYNGHHKRPSQRTSDIITPKKNSKNK